MLTLGWSDGNSFVPMALSMLSSPNDKNRLAPMRDGIDKRTIGYKRRQESMRKSTDVLVDMVSLAMTAETGARHLLLLDSWFAFPATIRRIKALGMQTICMLKDTGKVTYELQGWPLPLKDLYKSVRKRCGRAKVLAEVLVAIGSDDQGIPVSAKIVFVRDRSSKKWLAFLSTDTTLTAEEIIKLYKLSVPSFTLSAMRCGRLSLKKHWHCCLIYWKKPWATLLDCVKNRYSDRLSDLLRHYQEFSESLCYF